MAPKPQPQRRVCVICAHGARGGMLTCSGCAKHCHSECAQIKADDKQLKELEESFRCPLCLSLRAEGSRNRRDGVTQKRYTFATDHMKNPMLQPPNSSMFPHSLAGPSVDTSWSRVSLVESTKTQSLGKRHASDTSSSFAYKKRAGSRDLSESAGMRVPGRASPATSQVGETKSRSSSLCSNGTEESTSASPTADVKYCWPECTDPSSDDMIACDRCDQWFHFQCVQMTQAQADLIDTYYCSACYEHPTFVTTYKSQEGNDGTVETANANLKAETDYSAEPDRAHTSGQLVIEEPDVHQISRALTLTTSYKKKGSHEKELQSPHKACRPNTSLSDAWSRHDSGYAGSESSATSDVKNNPKHEEEEPDEDQKPPEEELPEDLHVGAARYEEPVEDEYDEQDYEAEILGEESEAVEDYETDCRSGVYMRTSPGDTLTDKYVVIRKLGFGTFGTVWLCLDQQLKRIVAVKIAKAGDSATRNAREEVKLLRAACKPSNHRGRKHIVDLLEVFEVPGLNGHPHVCTVFPVGESLLTYKDRKYPVGLPLGEVQRIMKEMLFGLEYLGKEMCMVHLDLKVENVLLMHTQKAVLDTALEVLSKKRLEPCHVSTYDAQSGKKLRIPKKTRKFLLKSLEQISTQLRDQPVEERRVCIADLGSAEFVNNLRALQQHGALQTSHYRAPEAVVHANGNGYGPWMDIWSAGCIAYELACGEILFNPRLDDEDDLLAHMQEALGRFPKELLRMWRRRSECYYKFFSDDGTLRKIKVLKEWSVENVLMQKHFWEEEKAMRFGLFLRQLLRYDVTTRPSASECLALEWINVRVD